ncbi:hypothetical protein [Enterococcus faecium]
MMKNTNYNNQINKILKEELYFKTDNIEEEIRERLNIFLKNQFINFTMII